MIRSIRSIWPQEQFLTKPLDLWPFSNFQPIGVSGGFYANKGIPVLTVS